MTEHSDPIRKSIEIQGIVQGVGLRPFLVRLARATGCTGTVVNDASGVLVEIQGSQEQVDHFLESLRQDLPEPAIVDSIAARPLPIVKQESDFLILPSILNGRASATVSADLATCQECLQELMDPLNRRYCYPFINCVQCGPRFSIQEGIPYDRQRTTMKSFSLCDACLQEFDSPGDRRFHAQIIACPTCGPTIWYLGGQPRLAEIDNWDLAPNKDRSPQAILATIGQVRRDIGRGAVVAIKGIGGFHLACDATNPSAVERLRFRKGRSSKPFAVMVADVETCMQIADCNSQQAQWLLSPQRPIVLLPKKASARISDLVAPSTSLIGIMLPYSPLHHLLIRPGDVWIMTSGNLSEEPIAYENRDAGRRLAKIADGFLLHDRSIHVPCDDSVVRAATGTGQNGLFQPAASVIPIRRSRGLAPFPIKLQQSGADMLALGGELKTVACLAVGDRAYLSQHIGDAENVETIEALERAVKHLQSLYPCNLSAVITDLHPGYLTTEWGRSWAKEYAVPLIQVQHHHAHAVSLIAEHYASEDQPIIACVFDGTGLGLDGAIWGGEFLVATAAGFVRRAHLKYIPLPGGDAAIRQPWRSALGFLHGSQLELELHREASHCVSERDRLLVGQQLKRNLNCFPTSSMGRLFDAVASLLGIRHFSDYEGQSASELETIAWEAVQEFPDEIESYPFRWLENGTWQWDCRGMLQAICQDIDAGVSRRKIAARFHRTIAAVALEVCIRLRQESRNGVSGKDANARECSPLGDSMSELNTVGLTGGVFQNALLLELLERNLLAHDFTVLTHRLVPCNDGGLALGQAVIGRSKING